MSDATCHVAILYLEFFIPAAESLKQKRAVMKGIKERVKNKFNVSVAEIGERDKWQRCTLGVAAINADKSYIDGQLQLIVSFVDAFHDAELTKYEIEFV